MDSSLFYFLESISTTYKSGKAIVRCAEKNNKLDVTTPLDPFEMDCVCEEGSCRWFANEGVSGYHEIIESKAQEWRCEPPLTAETIQETIVKLEQEALEGKIRYTAFVIIGQFCDLK